jgi:hypothetical protein
MSRRQASLGSDFDGLSPNGVGGDPSISSLPFILGLSKGASAAAPGAKKAQRSNQPATRASFSSDFDRLSPNGGRLLCLPTQ